MRCIQFHPLRNIVYLQGTWSPYHLKRMYFEFDKKNDMASYLSLSYQAMENVLQELDAVVKDEFASLTCVISP